MYADLLSTLLASSKKKIRVQDIEVTTAAIRQGLTSALLRFNQQMELCELPTIKGRVSVSEPSTSGIITIRIAPPAKATFTIIEDDTEEQEDG